jgi:diguanylate cyclase (GGDEF)-like protein
MEIFKTLKHCGVPPPVLDQVRRLVLHDPLTGLYNRRFLEPALERLSAAAQRYERPLALVFMDLDHFKQLNDTCGHPTGDAALRQTAAVLQRTCRAADLPGRWGGDEFAVILPETGRDGARRFAERLLTALRQEPAPDGGAWRFSASIGIAARPGTDLIAAADADLLRRKKERS